MKTKKLTKLYVLLLLFSLGSTCFCQTQTFYVNHFQIDPNYSSLEDSTIISRNTSFQLDKIYLFLGGTNSSPSSYNSIRSHAANLGFDFIGLSYPNSTATASLSSNTDSQAFDNYRQELCFGTPISNDVAVDTLNSIYTRTVKLLQYLHLTYPTQNWGQYLITQDSIDWSKIIIGGHSQGSGHAAYIAKFLSVDRVLMLAGPNDYSTHFSSAANWLGVPGITPLSKHFAYLSLHDEFGAFAKQFTNLSSLGMLTNDDTTHVDALSPPYGNSRFLYTTQPPGIVLFNHNVPTMFSSINSAVWEYMLTSTILTSLNDYSNHTDISSFPNPTTSFLYLNLAPSQKTKNYVLSDMSGKIILLGKIPASKEHFTIDVSDITNGTYFLTIDNFTSKIIKH